MSDLIDRQAAKEAYCEAFCTPGSRCPDGLCREVNEAFDAIKNLPSAQPEQRWIPCSERLPEEGRQVLVYARSVHFALAKYDEMREADGTYEKQWVTFDAWKPFYKIKGVIAWQPLPEPWRGEE